MPILQLNKKDLKLLDDMNQICKYLMSDYTITTEFKIFSHKENFKLNMGLHYAELPITYCDGSEFFKNSILHKIRFDAANIFNSFKLLKKKEIVDIHLINNFLYLNDIHDKKFIIGSIHEDEFTDKDLLNGFMQTKYIHTFSIDTILALVNNTIVVMKYDKFKVRLTKELIPNLKKDDTIIAYFTDRGESMLTVLFKVIKDKTQITTYHIYNAVNF